VLQKDSAPRKKLDKCRGIGDNIEEGGKQEPQSARYRSLFWMLRRTHPGDFVMTRILADEEIDRLLMERKPLPENWRKRLEPRQKAREAHRRRLYKVQGEDGHQFRIHVRDSTIGLFDFSIILVFVDVDGVEYPLIRFNGKHPSDHTNKWEKKRCKPNARFRNQFHIHRATERYQIDPQCRIDGYAEVTSRYHSFGSALEAFVKSNGFEIKRDMPNDQPTWF